jgi:DNA replication protein DnaC
MEIQDLNQIQEWKDQFTEFKDNPVGFLLFAGTNGTGKTFAAQTIFRKIKIPTSEERLFFTQSDLNIKWQETITRPGETLYLLQRLSEARILVLDDIGTRPPTEAFKDFIYCVIEKRERNKRQLGTILTTNLNSKQMREIFGDAICSRIASDRVFRFEGKDRRFKDF